MVRSRLFATLALVSAVGFATAAQAQTESRHRPRPRPTPTPAPVPRPPGGNDAGGNNNVRPGSLAPRSNLGIGTSSRPSIDLLSYPAANQTFPTPPIIVTPIPPRRDHDDDRARWWYKHRRDRDRYHNYPYYTYPTYQRETLLTFGTGLSVAGYGYAAPLAYPAATVGVMSLPAPAIVYDAATGTYVYGYANPYGPPLVSGGPYAAPPAAMPTPEPSRYEPPKPPTPIEEARDNMRLGMPERAITVLRDHLKKNPDDSRAQRVMALALLEHKRFDDGVASMRQAYRTDPNLANEPFNASEFGYTDDALRSLLLRTVTFANRVDSGSAWLTVAALMQAEGRTEQARNMLEKARKQGLEPEVLGAMKAALRD